MKIPLNCKLNKTQKDRHPFCDDLFISQNAYEILYGLDDNYNFLGFVHELRTFIGQGR